MTPQPPISTLFPYTTLFRSKLQDESVRRANSLPNQHAEQHRRCAYDNRCAQYPNQPNTNVLPNLKACSLPDYSNPNHLQLDRKSTRLNSSHSQISYAVFCLK